VIESTFRFACPGCGKKLNSPMAKAGGKGRCSACGARFKIPQAQFTHVELAAVELEPIPVAAVAPLPEYRVIDFGDRASVKAVAEAMTNHEPIALLTTDKLFKPLGHDVHSAHVWIEAAGGGHLMVLGAGLVVAAFTSTASMSKLGLYVAGGSILALTGGVVLQNILLLRPSYHGDVDGNPSGDKIRWVLMPNEAT
jgi:hypothetical protein